MHSRNKNRKPYKKEIDAPWVIEVISERFDNAIEMMLDKCVVYGGAVRDALAQLPLLGDLDIAVEQSQDMTLKHYFEESVKWRPDKGKAPKGPKKSTSIAEMEETLVQFYRTQNESHSDCIRRLAIKYNEDFGTDLTLMRAIVAVYEKHKEVMPAAPIIWNKHTKPMTAAKSYGKHIPPKIPISQINSYRGVDDAVVQIMKTKKPKTIQGVNPNSFDDLVQVARMVDIVCCGVVMDKDGHVFEVVENAHDDCLNRVLNINPVVVDETLKVDNLEERVNRLVERGWTSNIPLDELRTEVEELKVAAEKRAKAKRKRMRKSEKTYGKKAKQIPKDPKAISHFMHIKFSDALGDSNGYSSYKKSFRRTELFDYYGGPATFDMTVKRRAEKHGIPIHINQNLHDGNKNNYVMDVTLGNGNHSIPRSVIRDIFAPTRTPAPKKEVLINTSVKQLAAYDAGTSFSNYTAELSNGEARQIFGTDHSRRITDKLIHICNPNNVIVTVTRPHRESVLIRFEIDSNQRPNMPIQELINYLDPVRFNKKGKPSPGANRLDRLSFHFSPSTVHRVGGQKPMARAIRQRLETHGMRGDIHMRPAGGVDVHYNPGYGGDIIRDSMSALDDEIISGHPTHDQTRPEGVSTGRVRGVGSNRPIKAPMTATTAGLSRYLVSAEAVANMGGPDAARFLIQHRANDLNIPIDILISSSGSLEVRCAERAVTRAFEVMIGELTHANTPAPGRKAVRSDPRPRKKKVIRGKVKSRKVKASGIPEYKTLKTYT